MNKLEAFNDVILTIGTIVMILSVAITGLLYTIYDLLKKFINKKPKETDGGWVQPIRQEKYRVYDPAKDPVKQMEGKIENQFWD